MLRNPGRCCCPRPPVASFADEHVFLTRHRLQMAHRSYEGSSCFRQRLVLATLSRTTVSISSIRLNDEDPGLSESEVNLLALIDKISNGSCSEVDETGTRVTYTPGVLIGGKVDHDCGLDRSIGYFLEVLIAFAPFCKSPLEVTLKGVTNDPSDPSPDALKYTAIPVLKQFLKVHEANEVELKVVARGLKPKGGGIVHFKCPIRRVLKPIQWMDAGKIKRIRGVAFASRVSPQTANRMVDAAKGILLSFLPDVFIHTEHMRGNKSGMSPGFGIILFAETTRGVFYVGESVSRSDTSDGQVSVPEDIARQAAHSLFEEIYRGGCADSTVQGLTFLFMALGENDLSKALVGPLSPHSIQLLRHMRDFLKVTFKLDPHKEDNSRTGSGKVMATCVGIGFSNLSKVVS